MHEFALICEEFVEFVSGLGWYRRGVARRDDLWYIRPIRGNWIGKGPTPAAAVGVRPRVGRATNTEEMLI